LSREKLDQSPTGRVGTGGKRGASKWTEQLAAQRLRFWKFNRFSTQPFWCSAIIVAEA